jgi:histidinol dehydrogenase
MLEIIDGRDQMAPIHIGRPRPIAGGTDPGRVVEQIVSDVRARGDAAVIECTRRLDGVTLSPASIRVAKDDIAQARNLVRPELVEALEVMAERLRSTCEHQMPGSWIDRREDEQVGELIRPLERVGIYVPGGNAAYPSSVLMAAVPARVAGVQALAVVSPPGPDGHVPEPVLAACAIAGIDEVYRVGGAQAIAALAYGTDSIRPVDKIVGPGNIYVTLAKRMVQGWVGTDSQAGPTEILIVADADADPTAIATDLIAQAEHGPNGSHVLVTWTPDLVEQVIARLQLLVERHERADEVENALTEGGRAVLVRDLEQALETANVFAPEHLQLDFQGDHEVLDRVHSAGSVFVGPYSPVAVGDYVGGTNHVLPTGAAARWSSGLGVSDFVKRIYVSSFDESALTRLAPHIQALSDAEGLPSHGRSVRVRLDGSVGGLL